MKTKQFFLLGITGLLAATQVAAAQSFIVPAELWEHPRSGSVIQTSAEIRQAVQAYLAAPQTTVNIYHGSRESMQLQAEELRAWLIALAVDAGRIELMEDAKMTGPLRIEIKGK